MKLECSGSFDKTFSFLEKAQRAYIEKILNKYGKVGVELLSSATPVRTGKTASSWGYEIERSEDGIYTLYWKNSNVVKGINIALILQTGHGTKNGGYVSGINYIDPALEPLFKKLADDIWHEVTG